MSTLRFCFSARINVLLMTSNVSLCSQLPVVVQHPRTSISDNANTTECAPNRHFLHTKWAKLMLIRLNLSPKTHVLCVHVTTKVGVCIVTEKMKSKKLGWSSIRWLIVCRKSCLSYLFPYLHRPEVIKSVSYKETDCEDLGALCA